MYLHIMKAGIVSNISMYIGLPCTIYKVHHNKLAKHVTPEKKNTTNASSLKNKELQINKKE